LENLTLTGTGNLNGTGNSAGNVIIGNSGNNILTGGQGVDTLTGGGGADIFVFATGDSGATAGSRDLITDFTPGTDKIDLTGWDADSNTSGMQAFHFLGTSAFDGTAGALHTSYDAAHNVTILEGDTNGDKVADFGIELTGNLTLTTADFTNGSLQLPVIATATASGQTLNGGPLDDTLSDGGFSNVTLLGGAGNDTYIVSNATTVVTETGSTSTFVLPSGWTIKGTADFNKDGQLDVVVTNGSLNQIWLLNNGTVTSTTALPSEGFSGGWKIYGVADANGDGNPDILYTYPGVELELLMNGVTVASTTWTPGIAPNPIASLTTTTNAGIDTVQASVSYTLPSGLENLTLTGTGNLNGTGNSAGNVIIGNSGNNILTGGGGMDTFVFNPGFGKDTIKDYTAGQDIIQFDHTIFANTAAIVASAADDGQGNAIITAGAANSLTLEHMTVATIQQHLSDFHIV
jgi:Ca2+-binding RTX toxin-like protein